MEQALALGTALSAEVERLKTEARSMVELAGLGLTAEALSHEIANIAERLSQRLKAISPALKNVSDPRIHEFVEHTRAAVAGLRKQLSHIAPALRFAREKKERFDVRELIKEHEEFFAQRFAAKGIEIKTELGTSPFLVRTSRGKLTQVLDNLVLNSEYWLEEQGRRSGRGSLVVKVRTRPPHVLVSDSGPGIEPTIEAKIFQPFVTLKPKGRGLGLFIVQQLLDSLGCGICLRSERNAAGRRYVFDIDLSGALDDE